MRLTKELEWLRTMAHVVPVAIFRADENGVCTYVNDAWIELAGRSSNEIIGARWEVAIHPDDIERINAGWQESLERRIPFRIEHRYLRPSGRSVWVLSEVAREMDGKGRCTGYTGTVIDITEFRAMRDKLERANVSLAERIEDRVAELERMADIVANIDDAVISADLAGNITSWNRGAEVIFGYKAAEVLNQSAELIALDEDRGATREFYQHVLKGREVHRVETRARTKGGRVIDIAFSGFPLRDRQGMTIGAWAIVRNITERNLAERALRESERRYRTLHESMRDAFAVVRMDGQLVDCNPAFEAMLGYSREELMSMSYRNFTPEDWHEIEAKVIRDEVLVRGYSDVWEKEYRHKDGTVFPIELRIFLIESEDGEPTGMWAIIRDIRERKRAEKALRESEERYRLLADNTDDFLVLIDTVGNRLHVSPSYFRVTGWTREEVFATDWRVRVHPEDLPAAEAAHLENLAGHANSVEHRIRCSDDTYIWVEQRCRPLFDHEGRVEKLLLFARDITQRKRAEQQQQQLSRRLMAAQDEERRRIARELHDSTAQTIAALIMNLSALAQDGEAPKTARWRSLLGEALALAHSASGDLRTTACILHPPLLEESGLPAALGWLATNVRQRSGIEVKLEIASDFPRLPIERETALFRVVQESLHNAHRHSGTNLVEITLSRGKRELTLRVRDYGSGLPADVGENFGVGIAGMRERLLQLGGTLAFEACTPGTCVVARLKHKK